MARYIDADKISSYIRENFSIDKTKNADICFAFIDLMNWLDDQPTADVEEVKHGEWIYFYDTKGIKRCKCSECITSYGCLDTPYCPNCGAKMDKNDFKEN